MALVAALILMVHLAWLALVTFGAFWTRGRRVWSALHILALLWAIVVEVGPWPCPLTLAEQYFESRAGPSAYQGSFLLHYPGRNRVSQPSRLDCNERRSGRMRSESWSLLLAAPKGPSPSKQTALSSEPRRHSALPRQSASHSAGPKLKTPVASFIFGFPAHM